MSRYENHIETGLGTENGLFQGVSRLKTSLHVLENKQMLDNRIYQERGNIQGNAIVSPILVSPRNL
jgi:hypothetical protein